MTIGDLASSKQTKPISAASVISDVRTLIASHLGVRVSRVTDEAHFTKDLGADWLDRLDLMMAVEDQFAGVEITDAEADRIELVSDLIRHIETWDNERRRRGAAPVFRNFFGPHIARVLKPAKQQESCDEAALFFCGSRATRCVVSLVGAVIPDSQLIFSFMSTTPPWPVSGPMCCAFNARTAERNMRLRCSDLPRSHSRSNP